jgi:subtilase family serine protease
MNIFARIVSHMTLSAGLPRVASNTTLARCILFLNPVVKTRELLSRHRCSLCAAIAIAIVSINSQIVAEQLPNHIELRNHIPTYVSTVLDQGPVPDETSISNVTVLLKLTSDQEAALKALLDEQQDQASPNYHHWLTPDEFAAKFGASEAVVNPIHNWLRSYGLKTTLSPAKTYIAVSGSAAQFASAFNIRFHSFFVDGQSVTSLIDDPSVPDELAQSIQSVNGLSQHPTTLKRFTPQQTSVVHPQGTSSNGSHYITPADFATIYDINPVYKAGYTGAGQTIAIVGRSRVSNSDIQNFGTISNLTLNNPQVVLPPGSIDPGETNDGDQDEATLDVTRAASVAPGATVYLVISAASAGGYELAIQYVINNRSASIMSVSFGTCEANAGKAGTDFYNALFAQGAAEGITTFISAGDGGVDTCEGPDSLPATTQVASINHLCASPNVTCVGGTEFNDTTNSTLYWNAVNGAGHESAIGYIPEAAFNEPINASTGATKIFAGGGGISTYILAPNWQTGIPVKTGGFRAVPDISFSSSSHDGYNICLAYLGYPCVPNSQGTTLLRTIAGTSAAAPSMAGIQALLNQQENSSLGNVNPILYSLASDTANGVFHDVTVASSGVTNCTADIPSLCNNTTPSPASLQGGQLGYLVGTGYDLVTGWGSLDVYRLLSNWASRPKLATPTVHLTLSQTLVSAGQSITFAASMLPTSTTPTGSIQFRVNGQVVGEPLVLNSGTASLTYTVLGTTQVNKVDAVYSGDSNYIAAVSSAMQFVITPLGSPMFTITATPITIGAPGQSGTSSITVSPTSGFTGTVNLTCITTAGLTLGVCSFAPASVTLNSTPALSALTLKSVAPSLRIALTAAESPNERTRRAEKRGITGDLGLSLAVCLYMCRSRFKVHRSIGPLALLTVVGVFVISCGYTPTTVTVVSALNPATTQQAIPFQAVVAGPSGGALPAGSVQFLSNGLTIGAPVDLTNGTATFSQTFTAAGIYSITAQYLGSSSYRASFSPAITETITNKDPGTPVGAYSLLVQASSGAMSQTIPVMVTVQ